VIETHEHTRASSKRVQSVARLKLIIVWNRIASIDDGPNVELSPTKSLGEEFAGDQLIALS
jgi:hypothetical protein